MDDDIEDNLDDLISAWHSDAVAGVPLHEYLGMSEGEYAAFAERCEIPAAYMSPHRDDIEGDDPPEYTPPHRPTLAESAICVALCVGYAALMVWVSVHSGGPMR